MFKKLFTTLFVTLLATYAFATEIGDEQADTLLYLDEVYVTAIKQGLTALPMQPIATTLLTESQLTQNRVSGLKGVAQLTPNLYMPSYGSRTTSSLYMRGLGARIDHPVLGLNVDNVPIMNKDNFDLEMVDVSRVEVLRGPQSALYGRNTMGGVINLYTLSPLNYQGIRAALEYGSGNSVKSKLSLYDTTASGKFGYAIVAYYNQQDGLFTNQYNGELLDNEQLGGGRIKLQYRSDSGWLLENTLAGSILRQGGYPYQSLATGEIDYNDPSSFDRNNLTNGFTLTKQYDRVQFSSITSYQYSDNDLILDNDFTPADYFTLRQSVVEHSITQDIVVSSVPSEDSPYSWLAGAFLYAEHSTMEAPVLFKQTGIDSLIVANVNANNTQYSYEWLDETLLLESLFTTPTIAASLYHKSSYQWGRWLLSGELRFDYEATQLNYTNKTSTNYRATNKDDASKVYDVNIEIDNDDKLDLSFFEILPKLALQYQLETRGHLYLSAAKGYKAGGFNTQMFSDVLQQQLMNKMGVGKTYEVEDIIAYDPEESWNYELGGRLIWSELGLSTHFALFFIDCTNQQLTVFPEGSTTGRMMTNAGRTHSYGGEFSLRAALTEHLNLYADYGYTHATFVNYNDGVDDYAGNYVPYAPTHTVSVRGDYTLPLNSRYALTLGAGMQGVGKIYWDETNTIEQPYYSLFDASLALAAPHYTLTLWGNNLTNASYNTFYFESIGNQFVQRGNPLTAGITINIEI